MACGKTISTVLATAEAMKAASIPSRMTQMCG
jgi:hypothetical protein